MAHKQCLAKITRCDCVNDEIAELQRLRKRKYGIKKIEEFRDRLCQITKRHDALRGECEELVNDINLWIEKKKKRKN